MGGLRAALVVEKNPDVREIIRRILEDRGFITLGAASRSEAGEHLHRSDLRLIFLDLEIPAHPLQSLIARATEQQPAPLLIGMTGDHGEDPARAGVYGSLHDVLHKPLDEAMVRFRADRAIEMLSLIAEERRLRDELKKKLGFHGLVGRSRAIERLREKIAELSASDGSVWFTGEEGTGKRLAARITHETSARAGHPLTIVDCSAAKALPALHGEGTIYLEHPAALLPALQNDLLSEMRSMTPAQQRIVAGSHGDPIAEVKLGRLLPELHAALSASSLHLPPLRERVNDIPLLAQQFIATIGEINRLPPLRISSEAMAVLERYSWPGNVRELRDCIEKAVIFAVEGEIALHDLPERMRREGPTDWRLEDSGQLSARKFRDAKRGVVDSFEKAYLVDLLTRFRGNVTMASKHSGMLRSALQRLLRKHELRSADFRKSRMVRPGGRQVKPAVE
jgi:DNA-binding NtrC family response regulator